MSFAAFAERETESKVRRCFYMLSHQLIVRFEYVSSSTYALALDMSWSVGGFAGFAGRGIPAALGGGTSGGAFMFKLDV